MRPSIGIVTKDALITWEMKEIWRRLGRAGATGHLIDPTRWTAEVEGRRLVGPRGDPVRVDVVLGRVDAPLLWQGVTLLAALAGFGIPVINGADAFLKGRRKEVTSACLAGAGIPHPPTWVVAREDLRRVGPTLPYPVVCKPLVGAQGSGVRLIRSPAQLLNLARAGDRHFYLQRFCADAVEEQRILLLGDEVLGGYRKRAAGREWRANLALGARAEKIAVEPEVAELARRAAACIGAFFAGIDVLLCAAGPVVLEVNVCPQFRGFHEATGVDVAARLVHRLTELAGDVS